MIQEYQIRILPEQAASEEGIKRYLAKEKGLDVRTLNQVRVLKRSIDARQRTIFVNLKVRAYINEFPQRPVCPYRISGCEQQTSCYRCG